MRWSWMAEVVELCSKRLVIVIAGCDVLTRTYQVITFVGREKVPFARSRRDGRSQREWTLGFHVA